VKSKSLPPPPHSFEERIRRVRLWTVLPAVFVPVIAWDLIEPYSGLSAAASRRVGDLILYAFAFGWWLLMAAPRPYSLRASLGRSPDLAGWGIVALAMFGNTCVRIVWWMTQYCRNILEGVGPGRSYAFLLPRTNWPDAFNVVGTIVLAPLIEELLFRGTLFRSLRVRFGPGKAALLSSALFGVAHSDSVAVFISAMACVLVYTRTRSLWAAVALHALNNGGWFVLSKGYFGDFSEVRLEGRWQFAAFALTLLVGSALWVQFVRKTWRTLGDPLPPDSLQASPAENPSSLPEPVRAS